LLDIGRYLWLAIDVGYDRWSSGQKSKWWP
jgi:hypothetical protein